MTTHSEDDPRDVCERCGASAADGNGTYCSTCLALLTLEDDYQTAVEHWRAGRSDEAAELFLEATGLAFSTGEATFSAEDLEQAGCAALLRGEQYQRVLEATDGLSGGEWSTVRAVALLASGRVEEALKELDQARDLWGGTEVATLRRLALEALSRAGGANLDMERIASVLPRNPEAWFVASERLDAEEDWLRAELCRRIAVLTAAGTSTEPFTPSPE